MVLEEYKEEIEEVGKIFYRFSVMFLALSIFFFVFGFRKVSVHGFELYLPMPSFPSISAQTFHFLKKAFLPEKVELVVLNPLDALLIQIEISFFLSFLVSLPFLAYELSRFVLPAMKESEKSVVVEFLLPSILLFVCGCSFAYFVLIPLTFKFLYFYVFIAGIKPLLDASTFVSMVLGLFVASGILFLLPVCMVLLTLFAGIEPKIYLQNFKVAIVIFLIFAAVLTPDGSGVTQILFTVPLSFLYFLGYVWSRKVFERSAT